LDRRCGGGKLRQEKRRLGSSIRRRGGATEGTAETRAARAKDDVARMGGLHAYKYQCGLPKKERR